MLAQFQAKEVPTAINDLVDSFELKKGDKVFISSDLQKLAKHWIRSGFSFDRNSLSNCLIDAIIQKIGVNGTLVIPTYNWDFCGGQTFDYYKTPCKTGLLGTVALHRPDFKRTKHPIYSFAVFGNDQEYLCSLENKSSFGLDSPFAYFHEHGIKNVIIDVDYQNCFTFVHYVEEQTGAPYRYLKPFTADYIDCDGNVSNRTYSMYVRDLNIDPETAINPIGQILEDLNNSKKISNTGSSES